MRTPSQFRPKRNPILVAIAHFPIALVLAGLAYLILISAKAIQERNEQTAQHRLEQIIRDQESMLGPQHCRQATDRWACMTGRGGQ